MSQDPRVNRARKRRRKRRQERGRLRWLPSVCMVGSHPIDLKKQAADVRALKEYLGHCTYTTPLATFDPAIPMPDTTAARLLILWECPLVITDRANYVHEIRSSIEVDEDLVDDAVLRWWRDGP